MLTSLALLALVAPKPVPLTCDNVGKPVPLNLGTGQKATAQFDGEDLVVIWNGKRTLLPTQSCEEALGQRRLTLLDANFDGWADLSVFNNNYGYNGVNIMHYLYLAQPSRGTFRKSSLDLIDISTLKLDKTSKTVEYGTKDKPFYLQVTLCKTGDGKDLFTCRKDEGEGGRWVRWYDEKGKVVAQREKTSADATQFRVLRKTYFAPEFGGSAGTAYVIAGDKVEALQIRGDWVYAKYRQASGHVTVGWLMARNLQK